MITPAVYFGLQAGAFVLLTVLTEVFGRGIGTEYYHFNEEKELALDFSLGFAIASFIFSIITIWAGIVESVNFFGIAIPVIVLVASGVFVFLKIQEKVRGYSFFY